MLVDLTFFFKMFIVGYAKMTEEDPFSFTL